MFLHYQKGQGKKGAAWVGFKPAQSVMNLLSRHSSGRNQRRNHSKEPRICPEKLSLPHVRELSSLCQGIPLPCTSRALGIGTNFSLCGSHALHPCCTRAPLLMSSSSIITQRSTSSGWCCTQTQRDNPCLWQFRLGRDSKETQFALLLWAEGSLYPFAHELQGNWEPDWLFRHWSKVFWKAQGFGVL